MKTMPKTVKESGRVVGVCIAKNRGERKTQVSYIDLKEGHGVVGDAHAGSHKQVSLVAIEDIMEINHKYDLDAQTGDFAENITTQGINLMDFSPGDIITVGDAVLEVVCLGKSIEEMKSHHFSYKGYMLLPTVGLFCNVVKGGRVEPNDLISG